MIKKRETLLTLMAMVIAVHLYSGVIGDSTRVAFGKSGVGFWPHYFPVQVAGNIGFVSAGIGYSSRSEKFNVAIQYGYAPKSITDVEIHTLTVRNVFHLYKSRRQMFIPYAGLGLSLEVGGKSFFFLPSNMPKGYYKFPKSIHLIPAIGVKTRHRSGRNSRVKTIEIFGEATTVDAYIWYKLISSEVPMSRIITFSAGVNLIRL